MAKKSLKNKPPVRFAELTQFIVQQIPGIRTLQLVKTIYFLELEYLRKFGEHLTEVPIIRITMGPVPANYPYQFDCLKKNNLIVIEKGKDAYSGSRFYLIKEKEIGKHFTSVESDVVMPIINYIKQIIATQPSKATEIIKQKSYETIPMKRYLEMEKQLGKEKIGGYVLTTPYFTESDIDSLAEYRRVYRDHLKGANQYSIQDAENDIAVISNLKPFLKATNEYASKH